MLGVASKDLATERSSQEESHHDKTQKQGKNYDYYFDSK